jgi:serpin B
MSQILAARRLLLKAGLGGVLGLIADASLADILDTSNPDPSGREGLASAQARLGQNLLRTLVRRRSESGKADDANVIVSPASIACVLSLLELGANVPMRMAIHRTLGFKPAKRPREGRDMAALRASVTATLGQSGKDAPLVLANLVAFDRSTRPRQMAMLAVSGAGADVLVDDLNNPKIIDRINGWVRQKTRDLIPSIIEETPQTLSLIAVNALYFKDKWQVPFSPAKTQSVPFQALSGKPMEAMMMHSPVGKFAFRQDDRFIAAELAYASEDFKLVVVTTKSQPAPALDFVAVAGWLGGQEFEVRTGEIALPRLSLSAAEELMSALDALGLKSARLSPDSLEGFSSENPVISRVVQKLELRLNEEGTEAAAATAVVATRSLAPDDHVKMIVDKPFVFALRDVKTGLILMTGYVGSPGK